MIELKKTSVESFISPLQGEGEVRKVSLFLISSKNTRLKQLNLEKFSPEDRAANLKIWGEEHRFVLVIEKGDQIFAHAHPKYAEGLQGLEALSFGNKKVIVKTLSEEDADLVSAIGLEFEKHVLQDSGIESKKDGDKNILNGGIYSQRSRLQSMVKDRFFGLQSSATASIAQMIKTKLGSIISNSLRRFQEAKREYDEHIEQKTRRSDIEKNEIKKDVIRSEIKTEEIKKKNWPRISSIRILIR